MNGSLRAEKSSEETESEEMETAEQKMLRILVQRMKMKYSQPSIQNGRNFVPRDSDVFVATYPKCGTTWVTAICHALRTRGKMEFQSFEEIVEVVPWDIAAMDCGQDLDADQVAEPRVFKSHELWDNISKGGRYIYVCRNPEDALVSFYHFFPALYHCNDGSITIEGFSRFVLSGSFPVGMSWVHFVTWIQAALEMPDKILVTTFEDLKKDSKREIRRIADFLKTPDVDDALIDKVHDLTCFDYMKRHESQFDGHWVFDRLKHRMGLDDVKNAASKVQVGSSGSGKVQLPPTIRSLLREEWAKHARPILGVDTYEEAVETIIHAKLQTGNVK